MYFGKGHCFAITPCCPRAVKRSPLNAPMSSIHCHNRALGTCDQKVPSAYVMSFNRCILTMHVIFKCLGTYAGEPHLVRFFFLEIYLMNVLDILFRFKTNISACVRNIGHCFKHLNKVFSTRVIF